MNNIEIKKYLKFLKFKKFYKPTLRSCEICDSKNTKVFIRKISWNENKFGVLEVVKTNFEVIKASNDIYAARSSSLTHYFDTLTFAKFVKDAILTRARDFRI